MRERAVVFCCMFNKTQQAVEINKRLAFCRVDFNKTQRVTLDDKTQQLVNLTACCEKVTTLRMLPISTVFSEVADDPYVNHR